MRGPHDGHHESHDVHALIGAQAPDKAVRDRSITAFPVRLTRGVPALPYTEWLGCKLRLAGLWWTRWLRISTTKLFGRSVSGDETARTAVATTGLAVGLTGWRRRCRRSVREANDPFGAGVASRLVQCDEQASVIDLIWCHRDGHEPSSPRCASIRAAAATQSNGLEGERAGQCDRPGLVAVGAPSRTRRRSSGSDRLGHHRQVGGVT